MRPEQEDPCCAQLAEDVLPGGAAVPAGHGKHRAFAPPWEYVLAGHCAACPELSTYMPGGGKAAAVHAEAEVAPDAPWVLVLGGQGVQGPAPRVLLYELGGHWVH